MRNDGNLRVLELGAGCSGLPAVASALSGRAVSVIASDSRSSLLTSLQRNFQLNSLEVSSAADLSIGELVGLEIGHLLTLFLEGNFVIPLDWDRPETYSHLSGSIDLVLGAELLWAGCDPQPLVSCISGILSPTGVACVLLPDGMMFVPF